MCAGPRSPATRALRRNREVAALRAELRELYGMLDAYHAVMAEHGRAEDAKLTALYDEAYQASRREPCDLPAAWRAMKRFLWRALGVSTATRGTRSDHHRHTVRPVGLPRRWESG